MAATLNKAVPEIVLSASGTIEVGQLSAVIPKIVMVVALGGAQGSVVLPTIVGTATGLTGYVASGMSPGMTIHKVKLTEAFSGATASVSLPAMRLQAYGQPVVSGRLSGRLSRVRLQALALQEIRASLASFLPKVRISASGFYSPSSSLLGSIPHFRISASGVSGYSGTLASCLKSFSLTASSYAMGSNGGTLVLPAIRISAKVLGTSTGLSLNVKNMALTQYSDFNYNSLCVFKNNLIGFKSDGVYEITSDSENAQDIVWKIRTGKLDLQKNYLRYVWITGAMNDSIMMVVEDAEGNRYEYIGEPVSSAENEVRIKVGKGIKSRYVTIEFYNASENPITVDRIRVFGKPGLRKR